MPSALERAIAANRAALLAREQQATLTLLQAYTPARERLIQRIDQLVTAIQTKGELTPSEILKWDRAQALFAQIDEEVTRLAGIANREIVDAQGEMVAMADAHAKGLALVQVSDIANLVAAVDTAWNQLTPSNVEALVGRMADGSPLNATLAQFGAEAQREITERLLSAVALNTNPRDTAAELANVVDAQRWKLLRIARTEQLNAYRTATLQNYQANADIVDGWVWISAHQARTCLACLSLDGQEFPLSVDFQPSHANCRCSSIAIVKGVPRAEHQTGEEWFHAQSEATQREMLPKSLWDEFQNGDVRLSDFRQLDADPAWGNSYHEATIGQARANAERRGLTQAVTPHASFVRAQSVEEATAFSRTLGVQSADYGKNLHIANMTNEAMVDHVNRGYRVPNTIRTKTIASEGNLSPRTPAAFFPEHDALVLNPSSAYWRAPEKFAAEQAVMGFWSSDEVLQVLNHELGHVAHSDLLGIDEFRLASRRFLFSDIAGTKEAGVMVREVTGAVSRYALANEVEFVAEVYAGQLAGKTYSDVIMKLYEELHGPSVTKASRKAA